MLISRVAASILQKEQVIHEQADKQYHERQGSLNNLWLAKQRSIQDVYRNKQFLLDFECDLLNSAENGWVRSSAVILEGSLLQFYVHLRRQQNLSSIMLRDSVVVAHVKLGLIQISTEEQVVVFSVTPDLFEPLCATLFSWSRMRPSGMAAKRWIPPVPRLDLQDSSPLLRCGVMAQFTEYHPLGKEWSPYKAHLNATYQLSLVDENNNTVYEIQVSSIRNTQIKMVDPSLVGKAKVVMLFPDYGGPDTVYLKFDDEADYADWVATLKVLSQQVVAAPLSRDPLESVRWWDTLVVKIGRCELKNRVVESDASSSYSPSVMMSGGATTRTFSGVSYPGDGGSTQAGGLTPGAYHPETFGQFAQEGNSKMPQAADNISIAPSTMTANTVEPNRESQNSIKFQPSSKGLANTYVEICLRKWTFARTIENIDPEYAQWGQKFEFSDLEFDHQGLGPIQLKLRQTQDASQKVSNGDGITLGTAELVRWDLKDQWQWLNIEGTPYRIQVCVNSSRTPVLDSSYYIELQRSMDEIRERAALRVKKVYPSRINKFFTIYTSIYRAQGRHLEWVLNLATQEVDNMDLESETLFRGASLFTKTMELLMQENGTESLERTVGRFVRKLMAINEFFELDPSRMSETDDVKTNQVTADYFLQYLWSLIRMEEVPYQVKTVFQYMAFLLSENGMPDAKITMIMDRTLSAFLFLRFYGPALVNPQLHDLVPHTLDRKFQRTLVLMAKILQGFANRVRFGSKEMWLVPMNGFIERNEQDLSDWYLRVYENSAALQQSEQFHNALVPIQADEPPIKELPVDAYMGQQLTSPSLVDEWAMYAQLVNLVSIECKPLPKALEDPVADETILECQLVFDKQNEILKRLEESDTHTSSCEGPPPTLYFNKDTNLFGLSRDHLKYSFPPRKNTLTSDELVKINWLPKGSKSRFAHEDNISLTDERPRTQKPLRKLMNKLGFTKQSESSISR